MVAKLWSWAALELSKQPGTWNSDSNLVTLCNILLTVFRSNPTNTLQFAIKNGSLPPGGVDAYRGNSIFNGDDRVPIALNAPIAIAAQLFARAIRIQDTNPKFENVFLLLDRIWHDLEPKLRDYKLKKHQPKKHDNRGDSAAYFNTIILLLCASMFDNLF
jgi:hypothetical protein